MLRMQTGAETGVYRWHRGPGVGTLGTLGILVLPGIGGWRRRSGSLPASIWSVASSLCAYTMSDEAKPRRAARSCHRQS